MDIFQIKCFISAANIGNFTLAAYENNISQSSFSKQIMNLEDELGVELFFRKKRNIVLTAAGEHFLEYAYRMMSGYEEMKSGMESFIVSQTLPINVSSIPILSPYYMEDEIIKINNKFPDVVFSITEFPESSYVLQSLRRGESDFAIMRTDFLDPSIYEMYPIIKDRLVVILPSDHPLAGEDEISIADLRNEVMVMPPKDTDLRVISENACIHAGFRPNIKCITSGNVALTLQFVKKQKMVYFAFDKVISYYMVQGCVKKPLKEKIESWTAFVSMKSKSYTRTQQKIERFLSEEYGKKENIKV